MKFKDIRQVGDKLSFNTEMSPQEAEWLVSWAVERLLQEGILSISCSEPEQEVSLGTTH